MTEVLGWLSSFILVLTISTQVHRQWRLGTSKGVSHWLFIGQFAASSGFCVYSVLLKNWVFIATNGLLAIEALVGLAIVRVHRRREARASLHGGAATPTASPTTASPTTSQTPAEPHPVRFCHAHWSPAGSSVAAAEPLAAVSSGTSGAVGGAASSGGGNQSSARRM